MERYLRRTSRYTAPRITDPPNKRCSASGPAKNTKDHKDRP
ncbi:MAG: hypothetical protein ACYS32_18530 [Planctomycetota bacterium]